MQVTPVHPNLCQVFHSHLKMFRNISYSINFIFFEEVLLRPSIVLQPANFGLLTEDTVTPQDLPFQSSLRLFSCMLDLLFLYPCLLFCLFSSLFKGSASFDRVELSDKKYPVSKILRTYIFEDVFILFSYLTVELGIIF